MKKSIILAIVFCYISVSALAQHDHSTHQKQTTNSNKETTAKAIGDNEGSQQQPSQLLALYLNIKNALVTGDAASAASNAQEFLKTIKTLDYKVVSEGNVRILADDAGRISTTKDLKKQREFFVSFSSNMAAVAKSLKPGNQAIYMQYCPMKKASWLSSEKQIRNPYYGNSMLTCGEVTETL